jgi:hypothetical protein
LNTCGFHQVSTVAFSTQSLFLQLPNFIHPHLSAGVRYSSWHNFHLIFLCLFLHFYFICSKVERVRNIPAFQVL